MSFVISIIGCIFGCFLICPNMNIRRNIIFHWEATKKWSANNGKCSYPYVCGFRQPPYRTHNGLPY